MPIFYQLFDRSPSNARAENRMPVFRFYNRPPSNVRAAADYILGEAYSGKKGDLGSLRSGGDQIGDILQVGDTQAPERWSGSSGENTFRGGGSPRF